MNQNAPIEITKPGKHLLYAKWEDGFEATIQLKKLRDECPSADSREEREKMAENPMMMPTFKPGRNELLELNPVGNYAVAAVWADGHSTGIYAWDLFREIFERHKLTKTQIEELDKVNAKNDSVPQLKIKGK